MNVLPSIELRWFKHIRTLGANFTLQFRQPGGEWRNVPIEFEKYATPVVRGEIEQDQVTVKDSCGSTSS